MESAIDIKEGNESVVYIDQIVKNNVPGISSLLSFMGGRHVISDLYDHRPDILCNPFVKIIVLFSILFMNLKNIKLTITIFFVYIFFIDNYVDSVYECNK